MRVIHSNDEFWGLLEELYDKSTESLFVASPYMDQNANGFQCTFIEDIYKRLTRKTPRMEKTFIIGNVKYHDINSTSDCEKMRIKFEQKGFTAYVVKGEHSKVYVFDYKYILVGSHNLYDAPYRSDTSVLIEATTSDQWLDFLTPKIIDAIT